MEEKPVLEMKKLFQVYIYNFIEHICSEILKLCLVFNGNVRICAVLTFPVPSLPPLPTCNSTHCYEILVSWSLKLCHHHGCDAVATTSSEIKCVFSISASENDKCATHYMALWLRSRKHLPSQHKGVVRNPWTCALEMFFKT